jgi:hypothetical protein
MMQNRRRGIGTPDPLVRSAAMPDLARLDALKAGLASPGKAAAGDVANFADGGATFSMRRKLGGGRPCCEAADPTPARLKQQMTAEAGQVASMSSICALRRRTC